jgi:phenol 2-monooxygenase (NADPH)
MQFHLNGFKPGNPGLCDPADPTHVFEASNGLPEEVDVLIIGAGPTGLTLAAQLAAFPGIKTRIVEQKFGPLLLGQADGIACRTMEMFEAFGFSDRVLKEAYWVNETSFWRPDDRRRETLVRGGIIQDTEDGLSEFPHVILNQARVHDFFLEVMRSSPTRLEPNYARRLTELTIATSPADAGTGTQEGSASHPVTVCLERLDPAHQRQVEKVRARFVIGCDGARSKVRNALGRALQGDSANQAWGVMDVLAVTDFPDIRRKAAIHSANHGSALIIPREGGYLVRLYIELDKLAENERVADRNITIDRLIAAARRILHPYSLEVKEVAWWSIYEIGQRLCDSFDDVDEQGPDKRLPRVFVAGDACHTHSPKAGQGMNVSMQDSFNLGWKLASVVLGRCSPEILHTYSAERRAIAKELIDFDREFAKMFSASPKKPGDPGEGVDPAEFQRYFVKQGHFTAGTATRYGTSILCGSPKYQHLARDLLIGTRFHSAPVIRLADAKLVQLGHTIKADGRWRLFVFAPAEGSPGPGSAVRGLCEFLERSPQSPIVKYTRRQADVDSVIDVRVVFQQGHRHLGVGVMPALLLPRKGRYGLCDYEKVFCADSRSGHDIFAMRGIDRGRGCTVIVRPDQYISQVLPLEAHLEVAGFFDRFMLPVADA